MTAQLVTFVLIFGVGVGCLFLGWRMTPEKAERIRPYWHLGGPIWNLPFPLARLVWSLISLSLCGFAVVVLFGRVL
jgi:hypothetical protein